METALELRDAPDLRSRNAEVWRYLAIAFGFSWAAWILGIKLRAPEEILNVGSAGPAVAAVLLSWHRREGSSSHALLRTTAFFLLLAFGWVVGSWYYCWRSSSVLSFPLNPWVLCSAVLPAWIISGAFSRDGGVRVFLRRLWYPPNRWSAFAFLLFPAILGVPAFVAHLLHQRLVMPVRHGSVSASIAFAVVMFLYNVFFVAALEEPGWRGFLLDRLQLRYSPLLASLMVWLPWALWHAPLDYFRPERFSLAVYLQIRVVFLIPIVFILTWLYNRSGRSIQTAAIFHASMNTFPFVLPYFPPSFALLFVLAGCAVVADRMWRRRDGELIRTASSMA